MFDGILVLSLSALAEIASIVGADPTPHLEDAQEIHAAIIDELWDAGDRSDERARDHPGRAQRRGHDRVVRASPRPSPVDGRRRRHRAGPAIGELPSRPAGRLCRPELRPEGCGLRRTSVLARARLDQHELDALVGSPPARPDGAGRGDRRQQPPAGGAHRVPRILRPIRRTRVRDGLIRLDCGADDRSHRASRRGRAPPDE